MPLDLWIGFLASVLTTLAAIPQLVKIIQSKKAENISLLWIGILVLGLCGWLVYGILKKDYLILFSNLIAAGINLVIGFMSLKYKRKGKEQ